MQDSFKSLGLDAKLMVAGHFSFGPKTKLTFQTPWNVSPRARLALAEAVQAGVLTVSVGEEGLYAHTYRLTDACPDAGPWAMKNMNKGKGFNVMVADDQRQERAPASWPLPAGFKRHPR